MIEAASGKQALDLFPDGPKEIDLLLTDIVMPDGITGRELGETFRARKPGLSVIFVSGYSAEAAGMDTDFIHRNKDPFLQKPYSSHLLLRTVRRCIDETRRSG